MRSRIGSRCDAGTTRSRRQRGGARRRNVARKPELYFSLINCADHFYAESEAIIMLQPDIADLERRQKILEREIADALRCARPDDPMVADLKSRVLFVREQIENLRGQESARLH
jgi:hypothetical protein